VDRTFPTPWSIRKGDLAGAYAVEPDHPIDACRSPSVEEIISLFFDFIKDSCLCSYNSGFDMEFLYHELHKSGVSLDKVRKGHGGNICGGCVKMARRLLPGMQRYALWYVSERPGLPTRPRRTAPFDRRAYPGRVHD